MTTENKQFKGVLIMSEKIIDLNDSVHDICNKYPEMVQILEELGFKDITKPGMLNTAAKFMTLNKGAKMKKIDMNQIEDKLLAFGYKIRKG